MPILKQTEWTLKGRQARLTIKFISILFDKVPGIVKAHSSNELFGLTSQYKLCDGDDNGGSTMTELL